MPVDMCQPPAGKKSLTRSSGASSFDIFRGKDMSEPPFATRVFNDSVVETRNPFLDAARDMHDDPQTRSTQPRRSSCPTQPFLRGESHIKFGECMSSEEADASLHRRPGSECKQRELTGHDIFEGPQENGAAPKRPGSSKRAQELAGHNVFAFADACDMPPPPPILPYLPKERTIPPHNLHRNPRKFESHILGAAPAEDAATAPVRRPSTCPCPTATASSAAYEIQSKDGDGVHARARFVEEAKMRAFQGNHIFDFNDKPRNYVEDEEHFSISKLARRRDIKGNDIFGEGKPDNPYDQRSPAPCGKRHVGPCCNQSYAVDPLILSVNDPARYLSTSTNTLDPTSNNCNLLTIDR